MRNISNTFKQLFIIKSIFGSVLYIFSVKTVVSLSSGSRIERTGQEEKEKNWNILLKLEQSLDNIEKSVLDCRGGAGSDNVGPTTTTSTLTSLSEKLDNIQERLNILTRGEKKLNEEI